MINTVATLVLYARVSALLQVLGYKRLPAPIYPNFWEVPLCLEVRCWVSEERRSYANHALINFEVIHYSIIMTTVPNVIDHWRAELGAWILLESERPWPPLSKSIHFGPSLFTQDSPQYRLNYLKFLNREISDVE